MKPPKHHHFIFIRPPGSLTWTMHFNKNGMPWRDGRAKEADAEAQSLVQRFNYCAIVVPIALPQEPDNERYALLSDGDTKLVPTAL
jgi:hypothetical protein